MFTKLFKIFSERIVALYQTPAFEKTVDVTVTASIVTGIALEIKEAFRVASNSSLPITYRSVAAIKCSCCTASSFDNFIFSK